MATTQQMLNACDEVMKNQIAKLLTEFYFITKHPPLKTKALKKYTEIFFKIANMEHKYCRPKEE